MKIAVTSRGQTLDDGVDARFGRTRMFIVVDTDTGEFEVVDNKQALNAPQGAGIQSARNAMNAGAEAVLTGHCGPKAFRALKAAGTRVFLGAEGTVREAVDAFENGRYEEATSEDVEGHW